MEQENKSAFNRNKLYFEDLCQIINQDDDFAVLRTVVEAKERKREDEVLGIQCMLCIGCFFGIWKG